MALVRPLIHFKYRLSLALTIIYCGRYIISVNIMIPSSDVSSPSDTWDLSSRSRLRFIIFLSLSCGFLIQLMIISTHLLSNTVYFLIITFYFQDMRVIYNTLGPIKFRLIVSYMSTCYYVTREVASTLCSFIKWVKKPSNLKSNIAN